MPSRFKTFLLSVFLFFVASHAFADARWKRCIRMSFPSPKQGTMTNLCNNNLYATWYDDRGEHSTAIGSHSHLGLGTIHGRFQVHDAYPQSGFGDNSEKARSRSSSGSGSNSNFRRQQTSGANKEYCEQRRAHGYHSADLVEGGENPNLASQFRNAADAGYNACIRGGDYHQASHNSLFGKSSDLGESRSSRNSSSSGDRGQCGSTQHMCGRECCPD